MESVLKNDLRSAHSKQAYQWVDDSLIAVPHVLKKQWSLLKFPLSYFGTTVPFWFVSAMYMYSTVANWI